MTVTAVAGTGGMEWGGSGLVAFTHGSGQAAADLVVEWDLDGDGDFDQPGEDITADVLVGESVTGRDFPSQLTGLADAGQLRLELKNTDGRYSHFNTASPLNAPPFSVRNGGRIRVRTADAANPDPVLLARDRFRGSGALGVDELGNPWTVYDGGFTRQEDSTGRTLAVAGRDLTNGATATVDVGAADYYVQTRVRHRDGTAAFASIVYRFDDTSNFGTLRLEHNLLRLREVVAGVSTTIASVVVENRTDVTIGLAVDGNDVTAYLEGVPVISAPGDAYSSSSTDVGIRSFWNIQRPVSFDEFHVWDRLAADPVEGILWTGKVTGVTPHAPVDAPATVTVTAEGPLLDAARVEIDPPASVGDTSAHNGMTTGLLVGATLAAANLLHPPGPIAGGDITPGPVGLPAGKALEVARLFEETELGFIYETQEGRIGYAARGDRVGVAPVVAFSDTPGAQFQYRSLELGDWRREVFNRVRARLAPQLATLPAGFGVTASNGVGVDTNITFALPNTGDGAVVGDLLLVVIASTVGAAGVDWLTPIGWKNYRDAKDALGRLRIYGKTLEAGDLGATVLFYNDASTGGAWIASEYLIRKWYGDIDQGVVVAEPTGVGQPATPVDARNGVNNPPPVFPPWGPAPSLFLSVRGGFTSLGAPITVVSTDGECPNGYGNTTGTFLPGAVPGFAVALQHAVREACVQVEAPSPWSAGVDRFLGFEYVEVTTIAVRGFAGDPPEATGGQVVQVDDIDGQDRLDTILTHDSAAELFATEADARAYGEAVLLAHAGEHPIFTLTFPATLTEAYRAQACRRRVNDKIALVAAGATGMGVTGEFFIEAITNRWSDAGKQWWVTWQLSPA
jgi:hypothetical protein